MRKMLVFPLCLFLALLLAGCGEKVVVWNGETEYYAHVTLAVDETNLYEYVDAVGHVFVGTVEKVEQNLVPDEPEYGEDDLSVYKIRVDKNIRGRLGSQVECAKHGGIRQDGTMLLIQSDNSVDTGLPEEGGQYIFLAYAGRGGRLLLSEFFDNRPYSDDLLQEYLDYCRHSAPSDGEK